MNEYRRQFKEIAENRFGCLVDEGQNCSIIKPMKLQDHLIIPGLGAENSMFMRNNKNGVSR